MAGDFDAGGGDDGYVATDDGGGSDDGGADRDGGGDGGGSVAACQPLAPPAGPVVEVNPSQAGELRDIVAAAQSGTTIVLADGSYALDQGDATSRLSFSVPDVTLRSASGDPEAVILDGGWVTGELVSISASRVTIAELTLRRAYYHPIHITGGAADIEGVRIYRVRVSDPAEQGIKINPSGSGTYADRGLIECCRIEMSDAGRARVRNNCYTGGIDAHQAWGWTVRNNRIVGFWCEQGLSEHGVHFWTGSRDTLVEGNVIVDCARGIGFGLGENGNGNQRSYPDDPYTGVGYIGHFDGVIRNNFIAVTSVALLSSEYGFDSGITLDQARGSRVLHNSIVSSQAPFSSLEWRFDNTLVEIRNNLVSHNLRDRGGTAELGGNIEGAALDWFVDPGSGDLHLSGQQPAVDGGVRLEPGWCDLDIDGQTRDSRPDVGADELF
ncbi:MAG: hypothetical protein DRI34_08720 [Deltaproteobacteria bacterium]|nr:MAG: hypothetical protein DRI34_08720 [Deltaproteobacteria bacterium]